MKFRQGTWPKLTPLALMMLLLPLFAIPVSHAQGPAEYRSIDGTGNNIANPDWGSTDFPLLRLAPPAYEDGISIPRGGDNPSTLPSARSISNGVSAQTESIPNSVGASDYLWQWGQFMDHDIDITEPGAPQEPFAVVVPTGDPFFDPNNTGNALIFLSRSDFDPATGTSSSNPREQVNQITGWIDASNVYGSDAVRAELLRNRKNGKLKRSSGNLLPFDPNNPTQFIAGDVRANEQSGLTAMHTLFMREHNRLRKVILEIDPSLNREEVYQRARALVAAELQVITYKEFLPLLLGENAIPAYTGYDSSVNSSISNEFSTAAYRVGHTMLSPVLLRLDKDGEEISSGNLPLRDAFFDTSHIINDGIEPLLIGLAAQPAQEIDPFVVDDVRNFLFGAPGEGGFDLASLNIQRGRDHGIASYNDTREALGLGRVNSFAEITSDVALQGKLAAAYHNDVDKIDLWVGGLAEDHVDGALVGKTFHKILRDQFIALRDGDRFWHKNIDWTDYGFAADPLLDDDHDGDELTLSELKLSDVIDLNTKIRSKQENVFMAAEMIVYSSKGNPIKMKKTIRTKVEFRGQNISRIKVTCEADPAILKLKKTRWSSRIKKHGFNELYNDYNQVTGVWESEVEILGDPLVGEDKLVTLNYKAIGLGTTDITCVPEYYDPNGNLIPADNTPHSVTVK